MSYCINPETRDHINEAVGMLHIVKEKTKELTNFINSLDACTADDAPLGKKKKRPLSRYNIHLSKCMKGTDTGIKKPMIDCIKEWREIKAQEG